MTRSQQNLNDFIAALRFAARARHKEALRELLEAAIRPSIDIDLKKGLDSDATWEFSACFENISFAAGNGDSLIDWAAINANIERMDGLFTTVVQ